MTEQDLQAEVARLGRRLERERRARQEAEALAEKGTRELYERQCELELLNTLADAANGAATINDAIQVTLSALCNYTGWPVGHAYFVSDADDVLVPSGIWHLDPAKPHVFDEFRAVTEATTFMRGIGLPGTVFENAAPVWIPDVCKAANFPRAQYSRDIGVHAAFAFPVLAGTSVVAVLEFFSGACVEREATWMKFSSQVGLQLGRIFERRRAARELEKAHREMLDLSRRAGMAEVATGILHNVGNVLNSVSVSAAVMEDRLRRSKIGNLRLATQMLGEQNGSLAEFLTHDPKGKALPEYLHRAAGQLDKERDELVAEAGVMGKHIEHIKTIVAMQQDYAKVTSISEDLDAVKLVEDALHLNETAMHRHSIRVAREIDPACGAVRADRHKVLQILVNLIRNAKQAMTAGIGERVLTLIVEHGEEGRMALRVRDTGVGIPPENLAKIFNHGFTTKPDGHGFGLHGSANAAREMGGNLTGHSDGPGRGATFTLDLPAVTAQPTEKTP